MRGQIMFYLEPYRVCSTLLALSTCFVVSPDMESMWYKVFFSQITGQFKLSQILIRIVEIKHVDSPKLMRSVGNTCLQM